MSKVTPRTAMLSIRRLAVSGILLAAFAPAAGASCPVVSFSEATRAPLIFAGTVIGIESSKSDPAYFVTFKVDAVWKGTAGSTITIYQWNTSERMKLALGTRYLIFAGRAGRDVDFELGDCVSKTYEAAEKMGWIRDLGASRPPQ